MLVSSALANHSFGRIAQWLAAVSSAVLSQWAAKRLLTISN
jgi:hypothetical protein